MTKGKVKWYNEVKGFGFIEAENGDDVFVHRNNLVSPFSGLQDDEKVTFDIQKGEKGLFAVNVQSSN